MAVPELVHMAGMGLLTSVVAPSLALALRHRLTRGPGWWALPAFVALHAAITLRMGLAEPPLPLHVALDVALIAGAVGFWLPVLGRARLDDVARCVYLFLATTALDLPAVVLVARGDAAGGLAMIVAMLPIGLTAVVLTWRLVVAEEAAVRHIEALESRTREVSHADS